jgi:hypothetical protein
MRPDERKMDFNANQFQSAGYNHIHIDDCYQEALRDKQGKLVEGIALVLFA